MKKLLYILPLIVIGLLGTAIVVLSLRFESELDAAIPESSTIPDTAAVVSDIVVVASDTVASNLLSNYRLDIPDFSTSVPDYTDDVLVNRAIVWLATENSYTAVETIDSFYYDVLDTMDYYVLFDSKDLYIIRTDGVNSYATPVNYEEYLQEQERLNNLVVYEE